MSEMNSEKLDEFVRLIDEEHAGDLGAPQSMGLVERNPETEAALLLSQYPVDIPTATCP